MLLLVSVMLVLWTLRCREGIRVEMSIHAGVHFPSMAPSHMEVKARAWEEWPLIHFLPPRRAQTEHHFSGEKTFISGSYFCGRKKLSGHRGCVNTREKMCHMHSMHFFFSWSFPFRKAVTSMF